MIDWFKKKAKIILGIFFIGILIFIFWDKPVLDSPLGARKPQIGDVIGSKQVRIYKTDKLGKKLDNGEDVIQYAYIVGEISASDIIAEREAQKKGLTIIGEDIEKRGKKTRIFKTNEQNKFVLQAISGNPQFYKDNDGKWWQANYATATLLKFPDLPKVPEVVGWIPKAHAVTGTFFPDPGTGTNDIDCQLRQFEAASWAAAHDAADGNADDTDTADINNTSHSSAGLFYIDRGMLNFDTSSIGADSTIDSATFDFFLEDSNNTDSTYIGLVTNSITSTSCLQADYDLFSTTKQATDLNIADLGATGAYKTFTLNATGLTNISKTGTSKFATRIGRDIDNSAPTGLNGVDFSSADFAGTSQDPKLTVVYTAAAPAEGVNSVMIISD